jgi:hypothetical protein
MGRRKNKEASAPTSAPPKIEARWVVPSDGEQAAPNTIATHEWQVAHSNNEIDIFYSMKEASDYVLMNLRAELVRSDRYVVDIRHVVRHLHSRKT